MADPRNPSAAGRQSPKPPVPIRPYAPSEVLRREQSAAAPPPPATPPFDDDDPIWAPPVGAGAGPPRQKPAPRTRRKALFVLLLVVAIGATVGLLIMPNEDGTSSDRAARQTRTSTADTMRATGPGAVSVVPAAPAADPTAASTSGATPGSVNPPVPAATDVPAEIPLPNTGNAPDLAWAVAFAGLGLLLRWVVTRTRGA